MCVTGHSANFSQGWSDFFFDKDHAFNKKHIFPNFPEPPVIMPPTLDTGVHEVENRVLKSETRALE